MRIIRGTVCGSRRLARTGVELSRGARVRLQWMDYYQAHGRNAALTCRHFGISRQTFYRWKRRYGPHHLDTLEDRSHRSKRLREPTWSRELELAVLHPDLNPDEGVWSSLKGVEMRNVSCPSIPHPRAELSRAKERLRHKRSVLANCFAQARLV